MDDLDRRSHVPLLMAVVIALYVGSRIEATREPEALLLSVAVPAACGVAGAKPFADTGGALRTGAFVVAAAIVALTVARVTDALLAPGLLGPALRGTAPDVAALILFVLAVLVEAAGAARSVRSRFGAWLGIALGIGVYLPTHVLQKNNIGTVYGALFMGLFLGGGAGLLLGAFGAKLARRR